MTSIQDEIKEYTAADFYIGQRVDVGCYCGQATIIELNENNEVLLRYDSDNTEGCYDRLNCNQIMPIVEPGRSLSSLDNVEAEQLFILAFGYKPEAFRYLKSGPGPYLKTESVYVTNERHNLLIYSRGNIMVWRQDAEQTHVGFNAVNVVDYLRSLNVRFDLTK